MAKVLVETFKARGDSGKIYTVHDYAEEIWTNPISGPRQKTYGNRESFLDTGEVVNVYTPDGNTFQIRDTGEIIRKI